MLTVKWTEANCLLQTSPNLTNIASLNFHRKRPRGFFVPAGSDLPFSSRSCSNNSAEEPGSIFSTYSPRVSRLWLGEGKKIQKKQGCTAICPHPEAQRAISPHPSDAEPFSHQQHHELSSPASTSVGAEQVSSSNLDGEIFFPPSSPSRSSIIAAALWISRIIFREN